MGVVGKVGWVEKQQDSVGVTLLDAAEVMRGKMGGMQGWVGVVLGMVVRMLLAFAALLGIAAHLGSWDKLLSRAAVGASAVGVKAPVPVAEG